jgi:hypothetical protein
MKVTVRGRAALAAAVALAFGALLYQDLFILTALLILLGITVGEAIWVWVVVSRPTRWFSISKEEAAAQPFSISKSLYPGDTSHDDLRFLKKVGGGVAVLSGIPFLKITPNEFNKRGVASKVGADFKTPFAGRYSSDAVELAVTGPLRIVSATCALPAKFTYSVYPRTVRVAITSSMMLEKGGTGESAVERPGAGTEFYGIRKYQPGDYYRHINWKATARRGELMTNELMREVGGAYYLVLEALSPDYFDRDRLAATFLGIANALTMQGARFGVVLHDGRRVKQVKRIDAPAASLAFALKVAFEFAELSRTDFENELAATSSYSLGPIRKLLAAKGPTPLSRMEDFAMSEKRAFVLNQDFSKTMIDLVRESTDGIPAILYVSGMFGSVESVIELGSRVKRIYGANFMVANPTAPWVAAQDEDSAYDAYSRCAGKIKALRNAAIDYQLGEPSSLVQRVLSAQDSRAFARV